jgi:hypothetical protein
MRSNNERGTFTTSLLLPDVEKWRPPHKQRLTIAIASAKVGVCFSYQAAVRTGLTSVLISRLAINAITENNPNQYRER